MRLRLISLWSLWFEAQTTFGRTGRYALCCQDGSEDDQKSNSAGEEEGGEKQTTGEISLIGL